MRALIILEYENNEIISASLSALAAAKRLSLPVDAFIAGSQMGAIIEKAKQLPLVEHLYVADSETLKDLLPENIAPLLKKLAGDYQYILQAHTTHGRNIMPRLAALLDVPQVSDVIEINNDKTYIRPIYAGNAFVTVKNPSDKQLITIRAASFAPVSLTGGHAQVIKVDALADSNLVQCEGWEVHKSELPDLATASKVISGGRGIGSKDGFKRLEVIAEKLKAAVGASRAAVDAGFVTNDYQVGQTGKIVCPDLYIAVGISGAIQHLAGMKDSKCIVAINKDPDAPIFNNCDYGMVADLFDVLPQLEQALEHWKDAS
ncbi:electron transfer flavoprotein subunit alpha/FixB family protein [Facilibium subflavum]|uniref:electron transfer flavoprotein subunit alpha/FixB family protein n=1 Tax=Facilibium subflavum TaxID=2219058 RepID=UPI000E655712|nr:FAD-binding protein [Facilibium subflavum]